MQQQILISKIDKLFLFLINSLYKVQLWTPQSQGFFGYARSIIYLMVTCPQGYNDTHLSAWDHKDFH